MDEYWLVWWLMPEAGEPRALMIWALAGAVFFAAGLASRLVKVMTAPRDQLRDDR